MFTSEKAYELPLVKNYVAHWGLKEAVRELFQNALDCDSPFDVQFKDNILEITSVNSTLQARSLLLGATTKNDDPKSIGQFGEGYKIAMLVLVRLGKFVQILNGKFSWVPTFRESKIYDGEKTLHVIEHKHDVKGHVGLKFRICGITDDEYELIRLSCIHLWDDEQRGTYTQTSMGRIYPFPNKLYVNGLYVCDTELNHSYDVLPEFITLERDRQTVSSWDLKYTAKEMWFLTKQYDKIAEMMEADAPEMTYAGFSTPELVKEACYKLFKSKHSGKIAVKNQQELEACVKRGMEVVVVSQPYYGALHGHASYIAENRSYELKVPTVYLEEWLRNNASYMRKEAKVNFKSLLALSEKWVTKS